jgi:Reverse transcriptase (RNA-dependent DNA polymerase)
MMQGVSLGQQYILQKGLKVFGDKGREAGRKEVGQLHERSCFNPILMSELTEREKKRALAALMFLTEKRDGSIKGRMVADGSPTRDWHTKEEAASPTASLESIFLTAAIDAKERRDVMTADIPNAFIQASIPALKPGEDRVIMKLTGALMELLVEQAPDVYGPYVVMEKGKRVLYLQVMRALYGMLVAALLWYRKFREDLESQGFVFNPYDPCVANREVDRKQHTVRFHVDDLMSSHVDPEVNDEFLKWLNKMYGKHGEVKATRGKVHDYLGMTFHFKSDKVVISMTDYIKRLVDEFPEKINGTAPTPAAEDLFAEGKGAKLDPAKSKTLHTWVAKALFACKRARPDIHVATTLLCTRVKSPNQDDWNKLIRMLEFLNGTRDDVLTLRVDDLTLLKYYADASFAVHPDFKSHTGAYGTFGNGAAMSMSRKQKLNTRSSTEAELVGADDALNLILWTRLFLQAQGCKMKPTILYQDNKSAILLEKNGKKSSSKRTRALNIRYFFITDQIEKGNLTVEYCPTGDMIADFMTKPLQGHLFEKFRALIMGN